MKCPISLGLYRCGLLVLFINQVMLCLISLILSTMLIDLLWYILFYVLSEFTYLLLLILFFFLILFWLWWLFVFVFKFESAVDFDGCFPLFLYIYLILFLLLSPLFLLFNGELFKLLTVRGKLNCIELFSIFWPAWS